MLFKGPKSLLDSISNIIKEDRVKYEEEQVEREKLVAEKMLSPKQKKIAAVAGHPGKIDAADFAALRAGKQVKEGSDMPEKPFKYNKKTGTFDRVKKMEEEVEQVDELSKGTLGSYVRKAAKQAVGAANAAGREEMSTGKNSSDNRSLANRRMGGILRATRKMEEEVEQIDEISNETKKDFKARQERLAAASVQTAKDPVRLARLSKIPGYTAAMDLAKKTTQKEERDTPGNGREHQCAIHVKSEQFGEGKTLTTQHAEPDADGNIAWYDVMFEHGIERVNTEDLYVLVSEAHVHGKKKGM